MCKQDDAGALYIRYRILRETIVVHTLRSHHTEHASPLTNVGDTQNSHTRLLRVDASKIGPTHTGKCLAYIQTITPASGPAGCYCSPLAGSHPVLLVRWSSMYNYWRLVARLGAKNTSY